MAEHQPPKTRTPPVTLAQVAPAKPSAWPMVIGIIMIVWGAFGVLQSGIGMFAPLFMKAMERIVPQGQITGLEAIQQWVGWTTLLNVLLLGVAVLLLISGIGVARRRRHAVTLSKIWAASKILVVIFSATLGYMIQKDQFELMQQDPKLGAVLGGGFFTTIGVVSIAFGLLIGWSLPIFLLIWLNRRKIQAETATWEGKAIEVVTPTDGSSEHREHR